MAIESLDPSSAIFTTMSDVWSYGVLLWELMTRGAKPYAKMDPHDLGNRLRRGYRLEKPPAAPQIVYDLMLSCWEAKPNNRPSFKELKTQLEAYVTAANVSGVGNEASGRSISPPAAGVSPQKSDATIQQRTELQTDHQLTSAYAQLYTSVPSYSVDVTNADGYIQPVV
jgi:serine/threonine protein kinase